MPQTWILCFLVGLCFGVSYANLCTARGRFPNDAYSDCRGYTTCIPAAGGNFYQYNLTCPPTFIYSHIDNQCTNATSYTCLPDYNCNESGNFVDYDNANCSSYIACVDGLMDGVTARLVECPTDTVFSPILGFCVIASQYECKRVTETPKVSLSTTVSSDLAETSSQNLPSGAINLFKSWSLILTSLLGLYIIKNII